MRHISVLYLYAEFAEGSMNWIILFLKTSGISGLCSDEYRFRSSRTEVFLKKGVLKICSKCTGKHPCRSVISIKLQSNFIEITLRHGCCPVNLVHIFRTSFVKNISGWLLLSVVLFKFGDQNRDF